MDNVLELIGAGTYEFRLPPGTSSFNYNVIGGPGLPQPASNSQDGEFINLSMERRRVSGNRWPVKHAWFAVINWFVEEPRIIEYSFN